MKKKIAMIVAGMCMTSLLLAGCSSNEVSNDYVTVSGYKGIEVPKIDKPAEVTDEDVDSYIQSMLEQSGATKEVTGRAVKTGDTVDINFVGKVDGVAFEGGSAENEKLVIGSGSFIEGFEDSVIGHNIGDTYDWNGKFPDTYPKAELVGKDVVFTITVNSIGEPTTPELTDEYVKSVSTESETVKEYKKEVKKSIEDNEKSNYESSLKEEAWAAVVDKAEVKKYPKDETKEIKEQLIQQYKDAAGYYNMEYEAFITEQMQTTIEDFEKQVEKAAKNSVKQKLVGEAIAKKEKLEPSDDEYKKEFKKMAEQYGYEDVDALKEVADEDTLKTMVLQDRVKSWLSDNCVQVVEEEKKEGTKTDTTKTDTTKTDDTKTDDTKTDDTKTDDTKTDDTKSESGDANTKSDSSEK